MRKGWTMKKLSEVCQIIGGGTPSKSNPDFYNGEIPWATVRDMKSDVLSETEFKITIEAVRKSSTNIIPKDNVIIATRVGLGKVCFLKNNTAINQDLRGVIPISKKEVNVNFLFHWFKSIAHLIEEEGTGATVQGVKLPFIKSLPIPVPPVSEQKRIVFILDECFAAIDQAKANVEKNLKNARKLIEAEQNKIFNDQLDGSIKKKLGEIVIVERGSSPRPIQNYFTESNDGVNWVKIGDANENDKYIYTTKQKITKEGASRSRFVDVGDFILSNSMSFGRPYIMKVSGYIHDGWFVLRLPSDLNPDYFWYLLASPYIKQQFKQLAAGAIVQNISGDLVKKTVLPIPSLTKQKEIVKYLDKLHIHFQNLNVLYKKKYETLENLKKACLQKAFAGELTKETSELLA